MTKHRPPMTYQGPRLTEEQIGFLRLLAPSSNPEADRLRREIARLEAALVDIEAMATKAAARDPAFDPIAIAAARALAVPRAIRKAGL